MYIGRFVHFDVMVYICSSFALIRTTISSLSYSTLIVFAYDIYRFMHVLSDCQGNFLRGRRCCGNTLHQSAILEILVEDFDICQRPKYITRLQPLLDLIFEFVHKVHYYWQFS